MTLPALSARTSPERLRCSTPYTGSTLVTAQLRPRRVRVAARVAVLLTCGHDEPRRTGRLEPRGAGGVGASSAGGAGGARGGDRAARREDSGTGSGAVAVPPAGEDPRQRVGAAVAGPEGQPGRATRSEARAQARARRREP